MTAETEVFKMHSASRERLVHFLMASAGAATGFTVTLQNSLTFSWPDLLIILSTIFFAFSFWAGVKTVKHMHHLLYVNGVYLQDSRAYNDQSSRELLKRVATEQAFDPIQDKVQFWGWIQSTFLVTGAISLMAWRIAQGYPEFDPLASIALMF